MELNQNKFSLLLPPSGMRVSTIFHFVDFDVILMKKNVFFNYTSITFLVDKIIKLISLLYAKFYKENYFINLYYDSKLIKEKQI